MIERITPEWIAGFFDGEGSVSAYSTRTRRGKGLYENIKIAMSQNDYSLMKAIQSRHQEFHLRESPKNHWQLACWGKKAEPFLRLIEPLCIRKHSQIVLALELIGTLALKGRLSHRESVSEETMERRFAIRQEMDRAKISDSVAMIQ